MAPIQKQTPKQSCVKSLIYNLQYFSNFDHGMWRLYPTSMWLLYLTSIWQSYPTRMWQLYSISMWWLYPNSVWWFYQTSMWWLYPTAIDPFPGGIMFNKFRQVKHVMCHMSGQSSGTSWWRVCYQQGHPVQFMKSVYLWLI